MKNIFRPWMVMLLVAGVMTLQVAPVHAVVTDPATIRAQLTATLQSQIALAVKIGDTVTQNRLANILQQVAVITPEELMVFQNADLAGMIQAVNETSAQLDLAIANPVLPPVASPMAPLTPGFPGLRNANYLNSRTALICGENARSNGNVAIASDAALVVAEGVRDIAHDFCNQTIIAAGFGSNAATVCIISDGIYIAAKALNLFLEECDGIVDAAEIQGIYWRTEDIYNFALHSHNDLAAAVAAINSGNADIAQILTNLGFHDGDIKTALTAQDVVQAAHNIDLATHKSNMNTLMVNHSAALAAHDADIKAALAAQDAALATLTAALAAHDAALAAHDTRLQQAITAFGARLIAINNKLDIIMRRLP